MVTNSLRRLFSGHAISLAIFGAVAVSSCSSGGGGSGTSGTGGSIGTGGSMEPPISAGGCRWEGYGIGSAGQSQCDTQHLLVHAAAQCSGAGGTADWFRNIVAECGTEAGEVQVYCCYKDGLPAASDTPIAMSSEPMTGRLAPAPGEEPTRAAVLARAAASCLVGDWNVLYAPDGVFVDMLRFACR